MCLSMWAATSFTKSHIPNILTSQGLIEVLLVGNLIEFGELLNPCYYHKTKPLLVIQEQNRVRTKYRRFQSWFANSFVVLMDKFWVSSFYVFQRSLLDFASAVVGYKWDRHEIAKNSKCCNAKAFESSTRRHFEGDWPDLVMKLDELLKKPSNQFHWTGPEFQIRRRNEPHSVILEEKIDFPPHPIYLDTSGPKQRSHIDLLDDGDGKDVVGTVLASEPGYGMEFSAIEPNPSQSTAGPSQSTAGPSQSTAGPPQSTAGPSQSTAGPAAGPGVPVPVAPPSIGGSHRTRADIQGKCGIGMSSQGWLKPSQQTLSVNVKGDPDVVFDQIVAQKASQT